MQYPKVVYYFLDVLFIGVLKHKEIFHKTTTCTLYNVVDCTLYIVHCVPLGSNRFVEFFHKVHLQLCSESKLNNLDPEVTFCLPGSYLELKCFTKRHKYIRVHYCSYKLT